MAENSMDIIVKLIDEATATIEKIKGEVEGMGDKVEESAGKVSSFNDSLDASTKASTWIATGLAVASTAVVGFGILAVKAAGEAQAEMTKFTTTLETMGAKGVEATDTILKYAESVVKLGFDDETTALSVANLYQRTGDLTTAMGLNDIAMDLSRAKNMDLETASNLVGLVLSGNTKILKQYGIEISDTLSPMEMLDELQDKLSGKAEAFANSFEGQMAVFSIQWSNFMETVGDKFLPILTDLLTDLNSFISDTLPDWIDKIKDATDWLEKNYYVIFLVAGAITGALVPALVAMSKELLAVAIASAKSLLALSPYIAIGALVAGAIYVIYQGFVSLTEILNSFGYSWTDVWNGAVDIVENAANAVVNAIDWVLDRMGMLVPGLGILNDVASALGFDLGNLTINLDSLKASTEDVGGMSYETADALTALKESANTNLPPVGGAAADTADQVNEAFKSMGEAAQSLSDDITTSLEDSSAAIEDLLQQMEELKVSYIEDTNSEVEALAQAYVDTEQAISDKKIDIADKEQEKREALLDEEDLSKRNTLQSEYDAEIETMEKELAALEENLAQHETVYLAYSDEINKIREDSTQTALDLALEEFQTNILYINQQFEADINALNAKLLVETANQQAILEIQAAASQMAQEFVLSDEALTLESINRQIAAYNSLATAVTNAKAGKQTSAVSLNATTAAFESVYALSTTPTLSLSAATSATVAAAQTPITININNSSILSGTDVVEQIGDPIIQILKQYGAII